MRIRLNDFANQEQDPDPSVFNCLMTIFFKKFGFRSGKIKLDSSRSETTAQMYKWLNSAKSVLFSYRLWVPGQSSSCYLTWSPSIQDWGAHMASRRTSWNKTKNIFFFILLQVSCLLTVILISTVYKNNGIANFFFTPLKKLNKIQ